MAAWYATSVLGFQVYVLLWLFFVYSCAGVLIEGVFAWVTTRQLELRLGLLYLPLRPLYGVGGTACTLFLSPLLHHPVVVFALGVVICSVVEYLWGWALEKAFSTVSWDYSDKRLNLHGRICGQYSFAWGLLATAALYGCHPLVVAIAQSSRRSGETLLTVLIVLMLLSAGLTVAALARARRRVDAFKAQVPGKPATDVAGRGDRLVARLVPDAVLIQSFPAMGLSADLRELTRHRRTAVPGPSHPTPRVGAHALDVPKA